jgi:uncharacterized protein (TIGR03663 family)
MHADEAVQAARFRDLWLRGAWRYDPHEYHGPTLNYLTLPLAGAWRVQRFDETTPAMYRTLPVLFSVGLVLLLGLLADAWGKPAALCAGALTALSPAMVFYSRYYIPETLFVFFTFAAWTCGWRAYRSGRLVWYLAAGACLGMMQATKETSVIVFAAMAGAGLIGAWWRRSFPATWRPGTGTINGRHLLLAGAAALAVAAIWLSSFGRNPRGPLDGLLTYLPWVNRAVGQSPHVHPWYYYLSLLGFWRAADGPWWSEGLILGLAVVGGLIVLGPLAPRVVTEIGQSPARWIEFCSLLLTVAYAAIPYKTPWCLLGFLHGTILLAGAGVVYLVRAVRGATLKAVAGVLLVSAMAHLGWQAFSGSFRFPADPRNPYVYAHTGTDVFEIVGRLKDLARAHPDGAAIPVQVISRENLWPLPWYLRDFSRVGWWNGVSDEAAAAPVIVVTPDMEPALARRLYELPPPGERELYVSVFEAPVSLRPGVALRGYAAKSLWDAFRDLEATHGPTGTSE